VTTHSISKPTELERIPTEIFRLILGEVASPMMPLGVACTLGQPNADLKAMRLWSKRFAEQATPYLFKTLLVFVTTESFARMTAIANHTHYRHFVSEVRVFPRHFAVESPFDEESDYQDHIAGLSLDDIYSDPENPDRDPWTSEQLGLAYTHYTSMRRKQSELLPHVQALLQDAFGKFSTLKNVKARRFGDELRYKIKQQRPSLPPTLLDFHRRTLLLLSGDRQAIYYTSPGDEEFAEETLIIMRAIALSNANIELLWLCDRKRNPDLGHVNLSGSEVLSAKTTFAKLKILKFPLPELDEYTKDIDHRPSMKTWIRLLESASNLETLNLSGHLGLSCGHGRECDVVFSNAYFPRLRKLGLTNFSASSIPISAFVKRHASTLRKIKLRDFRLLIGSWYGIFNDIRREGLCVYVSRLGCLCHCQEYFHGEQKYQQRRQLKGYMQEGQCWPSDLPMGLLKEASEEYESDAESEGN